MRIPGGVWWKTAFLTKQALFVYIVMPFSLTSTTISFQELIHTIFKYITGCICDFDNVVIHGGNTTAKHQDIVKKVLEQCVQCRLAVNLLYREFHIHETIIFIHGIKGEGVKMDPTKYKTMYQWPIVIKENNVEAF